MNSDLQLADAHRILALPRALTAVSSLSSDPNFLEVDAEYLHQLYLVDGLIELLDWSRQGLAADPLACMWLASIRWYKLLNGDYPETAPQPPARELDTVLERKLSQGSLLVTSGSGRHSLSGLSTGEMGYPKKPQQPHEDDVNGLLRIIVIGLIPYIDEDMRQSWAEQALSLTQGNPDLTKKARALVETFSASCTKETSSAMAKQAAQQTVNSLFESANPAVSTIAQTQLEACWQGEDSSTEHAVLSEILAPLIKNWTDVTKPASSS